MWHKRITIVLQAVYVSAKLSNEFSPHRSAGVKVSFCVKLISTDKLTKAIHKCQLCDLLPSQYCEAYCLQTSLPKSIKHTAVCTRCFPYKCLKHFLCTYEEAWGKQWQTTPKNLPRLQHTRAIPVAWLSSGLCPDRPKGWIPIIIMKLLQACAIWWITHNITFLRNYVSCGWAT